MKFLGTEPKAIEHVKKQMVKPLKNKVGSYVLPKGFSVTFDPSIQKKNGKLLSGCYKYDDEGIKGQPVTIVENGVFKGYLMSRCPINKISVSKRPRQSPSRFCHGNTAIEYAGNGQQNILL